MIESCRPGCGFIIFAGPSAAGEKPDAARAKGRAGVALFGLAEPGGPAPPRRLQVQLQELSRHSARPPSPLRTAGRVYRRLLGKQTMFSGQLYTQSDDELDSGFHEECVFRGHQRVKC